MKVELMYMTDEIIAGKAAAVCRASSGVEEEYYLHLIDRVLAQGHDSIAEHVNYTFRISGISRVCSHQLVRHRIASFSQQSQRHVIPTGENTDWYVIPLTVLDKPRGKEIFNRVIEQVIGNYNALKQMGVPIEDCRFLLPNATKTEIVMTMNARSLWNLFDHRICNKAQWEIRKMAIMMLHILTNCSPKLFGNWKPKCDRCKEPCGKKLDLELGNGTIISGKIIED